MIEQPKPAGDFEILISNVLRIGVVSSLVVIFAGTVLTFARHPDYTSSGPELTRLTQPGAVFPHSLSEIGIGLKQFQGRSVIEVGLLMLIATPVLRVAISVLAFAKQKDRAFVIITSIVLILLLLSFVLGRAEG